MFVDHFEVRFDITSIEASGKLVIDSRVVDVSFACDASRLLATRSAMHCLAMHRMSKHRIRRPLYI
ncbi:protein of unknown function [Pararobbsia alpina]